MITALWLVASLIFVFLGRALYFDLRYRFLRKVETRWHAYFTLTNPTYNDPSVRWLEERSKKVKRLVQESGTAPADIRFMNSAGFGYVVPADLDPLDNWLHKNQQITPLVSTSLVRAQGHYKDERNRNLNPLAWIESLVFLPRNLISSVDPRVPKWVKDIVQIIYWMASAVGVVYKMIQ